MERPRTSKIHDSYIKNNQHNLVPQVQRSNYGIMNFEEKTYAEQLQLNDFRQCKSQNIDEPHYKEDDKKQKLGDNKQFQILQLLLQYELQKMGYPPAQTKNNILRALNQIIKQGITIKAKQIRAKAIEIRNKIVNQIQNLSQLNSESSLNAKENRTGRRPIEIERQYHDSRQITSQRGEVTIKYQQNIHQNINRRDIISQHYLNSDSQERNQQIGHSAYSQQDRQNRQNIQNGDIIECSVCYIITNRPLKLGCGHQFCFMCLKNIVLQNSESGNFLVECPQYHCGQIITEKQVQKFLQGPKLQRYLHFRRKFELQNDPANKFCSQPNCDQILVASEHEEQLICNKCKIVYCNICLMKSHRGVGCSDFVFSALYRNKRIKKCPSCNSPIQKQGGCNHMTCKKCKAEFCWLCLKITSEYHYRLYNCCGCPGMLFQQDDSNLLCIRIVQILFFIFLPLIIALFTAGVFMFLPLFMIYTFFVKPCRWLEEIDNPKLQLRFISFIFGCKCHFAEVLKAFFGFILFLPRSALYITFIAPFKYFIGVCSEIRIML